MTTSPDAPTPGQRRRRSEQASTGRRAAARRRARRQASLRVTFWIFTVVALALAGIWLAMQFDLTGGGDEPAADVPTPPVAVGDDPQPSIVLATFDDQDPEAGASQVVVLAHDVEAGTGVILLVPATTVADIPGHGLLQLGRAYGFGQGPLLDLTLDNLLGVDLDGVAGVSRQGWSALFTRIDGLTITVDRQLTTETASGQRQVRFEPGEQFLDGPRLAEYLTFVDPGESELQRLPRIQRVFEAFLTAVAEDETLLDEIFADGAPMLDVGEPDRVRGILELLAADLTAETLQVRTLPVTPIGTGDESSYRLEQARAEALIAEQFAGSLSASPDGAGRDLQILNGNGLPGIGSKVAELLQPAGFRVVLTGNADSFDYARTRVVVYDDDPAQLAVARQIVELLGVGEVELSAVPQDVVDITVVVGADFTG